MGRGNWFPGNDVQKCEVAYAEIISPNDDVDSDQCEWEVSDFLKTLKECLGNSFDVNPTTNEVSKRFDNLGRNDLCIAFNGLYGVFIDGQAEAHHFGVGVLVRNDAPNFAEYGLNLFGQRLFDKLQECYPLSIRCDAYVCAERAMSVC